MPCRHRAQINSQAALVIPATSRIERQKTSKPAGVLARHGDDENRKRFERGRWLYMAEVLTNAIKTHDGRRPRTDECRPGRLVRLPHVPAVTRAVVTHCQLASRCWWRFVTRSACRLDPGCV